MRASFCAAMLVVGGLAACSRANPAFLARTDGPSISATDAAAPDGGNLPDARHVVAPSPDAMDRPPWLADAPALDAPAPTFDSAVFPPDAATLADPDAAPLLEPDAEGPDAIRPVDPGLAVGLVGYWRFDDPAPSATARDHSGNGNHGVLEGLRPEEAWTTGRFGGALQMPDRPGTQSVRVPPSASLDAVRSGFTISAWLLRARPVTPGRYYSLFSRQVGMTFRESYNLLLHGHVLEGWIFAGDLFVNARSPAALPTDTDWIHVAATYDGSFFRVYFDGVQAAATPINGPLVTDVGNPVLIGTNVNTVRQPEPYAGRLDEVAFWGRALSPTEVELLAKGWAPVP